MKLLSVSPFRAVIKVQDNESDEDSLSEQGDYDLNRETMGQHVVEQQFKQPTMSSPMKGDSQAMRGPREEYLSAFNEKREVQSTQSRQFSGSKSQERIKKESEYLRSQRENFLSGF